MSVGHCHEADERSAFRNPAAAHGRGHRNPGRPCERGAGQGGPRRTRAGRDLKVTSWIDTDADGRPREIAEIIIALGSAGVFTAIVSAIRVWLERNKIKDAVLEAPNGTKISVKGATADDIRRIANALRL